ncbi:hypothetical protein FE633_43875 [Streptomyces montanus]|uniref:Uncharacterized protein n=1 Tax=Streptomyces montanus TaxID=2580423 RepID=A0A5R9FHC5_9ACTN|nr:hypothetical protein [Streptomyces montanus]TLS39984.1 hypothetical protein FE633_43875 [Streptomyces montanus]
MRTLSRRLALTPLLVAAACLTAAAPASAGPPAEPPSLRPVAAPAAAAAPASCDIDSSDVTGLQEAIDACVQSRLEMSLGATSLTADMIEAALVEIGPGIGLEVGLEIGLP